MVFLFIDLLTPRNVSKKVCRRDLIDSSARTQIVVVATHFFLKVGTLLLI